MTTRTHYDRQPAELPASLPAGTRNKFGSYTAATVVALLEGKYRGQWRNEARGSTGGGYLDPENIDWATVPLPTQEPGEPLAEPCAACGGPGGRRHVGAAYRLDNADHLLCDGCWETPSFDVDRSVRARRAKESSAEPGAFTCHRCSQRFANGELHRMDQDYCGECFEIALKSESDAACKCGHAGCSSCDIPPPVLALCANPPCAARGVARALRSGGLCVYCAHATDSGQVDRKAGDAITAGAMQNTEAHPNELTARRNLAAWDRAEQRPRGNTKERAELAKPHPWEEF